MSVAIEGVVELGGTGDLAERWGVTTQRVRQLAEDDTFPEQLGTVNGNPVYDVDECDAWRELHKRGRGRPRKSAEQLAELAAAWST